MGTVAAPFLAGIAIALAVLVISDAKDFGEVGMSLFALVLAMVALVTCVECAFMARRHVVTPSQLQEWNPTGTKEWFELEQVGEKAAFRKMGGVGAARVQRGDLGVCLGGGRDARALWRLERCGSVASRRVRAGVRVACLPSRSGRYHLVGRRKGEAHTELGEDRGASARLGFERAPIFVVGQPPLAARAAVWVFARRGLLLDFVGIDGAILAVIVSHVLHPKRDGLSRGSFCGAAGSDRRPSRSDPFSPGR